MTLCDQRLHRWKKQSNYYTATVVGVLYLSLTYLSPAVTVKSATVMSASFWQAYHPTSVSFPFTPSYQQRTIVSHCEQLHNPSLSRMSHDHPQTTTSSSTNFQQIFNGALKAYAKRTKNDLLLHPLAAQLQACDSPDAILSVLQKQVEDLNRSRNADERWTKWLDPTVNVLFSFSATIGEGVGLVCTRIWTDLRHGPSYVFGRSSHRPK